MFYAVMGKDKDINIVVIGHVYSGDPATTCDLINKLGVTDGKFETSKYHCTITDAPEQADCAVLIIDSTTIVSILSKDGHIQHTLRAFALGRKQLICCCNEVYITLLLKHIYEVPFISSIKARACSLN
jgi:translation elongation factor EF-1alpha